MQTEKFTLGYGVEFDGKRHTEGEMRLPTMLDVEIALEETPDDACQPRVARHTWARCITRLGDIPKDKITAELLATAADSEFGVLRAAEIALKKKLKPSSGAKA